MSSISATNCANCQNQSVSRCSRCKKVYYCSRACQLDHWSKHKKACVQNADDRDKKSTTATKDSLEWNPFHKMQIKCKLSPFRNNVILHLKISKVYYETLCNYFLNIECKYLSKYFCNSVNDTNYNYNDKYVTYTFSRLINGGKCYSPRDDKSRKCDLFLLLNSYPFPYKVKLLIQVCNQSNTKQFTNIFKFTKKIPFNTYYIFDKNDEIGYRTDDNVGFVRPGIVFKGNEKDNATQIEIKPIDDNIKWHQKFIFDKNQSKMYNSNVLTKDNTIFKTVDYVTAPLLSSYKTIEMCTRNNYFDSVLSMILCHDVNLTVDHDRDSVENINININYNLTRLQNMYSTLCDIIGDYNDSVYNGNKAGYEYGLYSRFFDRSKYKYDKIYDNYYTSQRISSIILGYLVCSNVRYRLVCPYCCDTNIIGPITTYNSHIKTIIEKCQQDVEMQEKIEKRGVIWRMLVNLNTYCDMCSVGLHWSDYQFSCKNMHDICIRCMNKQRLKHKYLTSLLQNHIENQLNVDCIEIIVSFVIGHFVEFEYQCQQ